jgi:hypothetical protein
MFPLSFPLLPSSLTFFLFFSSPFDTGQPPPPFLAEHLGRHTTITTGTYLIDLWQATQEVRHLRSVSVEHGDQGGVCCTPAHQTVQVMYLRLQPDTSTTPLPMGYASIGFPSVGYTSIKHLNI